MRTILGLALALFVVALATPSLAQAPEHLWSEGFGGFNNDFGNAIAVDAAGNVVVVGGFSQAVSFGGPTLVSDSGSEDIFMAKYDANGAHLWSKRFGGPGSDVASGVAVDGSGNIFVTGSFHGAVNFGGGNVVSPGGNASMFLAKYDANGAHQWSEGFGGAGDPNSGAVGNAIALDGSGNVVVAGTFAGTVNLGGGNVVGAGNFDMFLAKYDANGAHQWSHGFGGVGFDWGLGVAVDGSGNVVATGNFEGTVNFGGGNLVSAGGYDMFLAKYDPNGVHVWSRRFGGSGGDQGSGVAVDGSGNVVVTGAFEGTANFGGANLVSAGSGDIFLAKYTANGVHQWSERFGGVGSDGGNAVAVDGSGNVVVTGAFAASVYFGGNLGWSSAGAEDMFIARFSAGGAYQYSRAGGGTSDDYGEAVAVDGSGKAVATGSYSGAADFGGASLAGSGGNDIFIVKYGSEPLLLQIKDLPLDQGGVLKVFFSASSHDGPGLNPRVTQYEAFRRTNSPAGPAWVSVAQIPATMAAEYEMPAPTDGDSTCAGPHYSYYFIRAHTATPGVFYDSPIDSGSSVDNLPPGVPTNLTYAAGHLSWNSSSAPDFDHFSVYGNSTNSFASATFVNNTVTPGMNVPPPVYAYYFVTATDHACNESGAASTGTLTGVGGTPTSYELSISAYPNPFNPETTVRYTLPAKGRVTIDVFDTRGAHVATLVDAVTPAGAYTKTWSGHDDHGNAVGTGVYFARLTSPSGTRSYKLTLLK